MNRSVIAQAGREFSAASVRAAENSDPHAREHLAREVHRAGCRLVEGGTVGGTGLVDIAQARHAAAEQRRSITEQTLPGTDLCEVATERRRIELRLAELEAGDDTTAALCEPDEEIEP